MVMDLWKIANYFKIFSQQWFGIDILNCINDTPMIGDVGDHNLSVPTVGLAYSESLVHVFH